MVVSSTKSPLDKAKSEVYVESLLRDALRVEIEVAKSEQNLMKNHVKLLKLKVILWRLENE